MFDIRAACLPTVDTCPDQGIFSAVHAAGKNGSNWFRRKPPRLSRAGKPHIVHRFTGRKASARRICKLSKKDKSDKSYYSIFHHEIQAFSDEKNGTRVKIFAESLDVLPIIPACFLKRLWQKRKFLPDSRKNAGTGAGAKVTEKRAAIISLGSNPF